MKKILPLLILLPLLLPLAASALDVPELRGYVNDYASMISPSTKAQLAEKLKAFEESDSTQIVILTISSLKGEVIEDFGIKVAESWKIGQKGKDNGVLFLVSKQDRKMRIEVGRGLEGRLTDLVAGRIIDLVIAPRFKSGDFDGGFTAGVSALIDATRGEFQANQRRSPRGRSYGYYYPPLTLPFWLPPWLLMTFVLGFFVLFAIAASRASHKAGRRRDRRGGWYLGRGGGFDSPFGGGGGGFGGGGGGFGGGGASGGW
jgi:uncharacterized protein